MACHALPVPNTRGIKQKKLVILDLDNLTTESNISAETKLKRPLVKKIQLVTEYSL